MGFWAVEQSKLSGAKCELGEDVRRVRRGRRSWYVSKYSEKIMGEFTLNGAPPLAAWASPIRTYFIFMVYIWSCSLAPALLADSEISKNTIGSDIPKQGYSSPALPFEFPPPPVLTVRRISPVKKIPILRTSGQPEIHQRRDWRERTRYLTPHPLISPGAARSSRQTGTRDESQIDIIIY